jgi:hypothetical protein
MRRLRRGAGEYQKDVCADNAAGDGGAAVGSQPPEMLPEDLLTSAKIGVPTPCASPKKGFRQHTVQRRETPCEPT